MRRYSVLVRELWQQWYTVDAKDDADAIHRVAQGEGAPHEGGASLSYVDCHPSEGDSTWLVLEEPNMENADGG